MKKIKPT